MAVHFRTFQEYHLSTRVVFFGQPTLMWECVSSRHDECLDVPHHNIDVHQIITKAHLVRSLHLEGPEIHSWELGDPRSFTAWNLLVSEYRSRAITNPGDRIIALAGIARAIHNLTKLTYLAGLWAEHFPYCLLWRRLDKFETGNWRRLDEFKTGNEPAEESVVPGIPSWSWFSIPINSPSRLDMSFERYRNLSGAKLTSFKWPAMRPNKLPPNSFYAAIWPYQLPLNSFYDFQGLSTTLRMRYLYMSTAKRSRMSIQEYFKTELKSLGFDAVWYNSYSDTKEDSPLGFEDLEYNSYSDTEEYPPQISDNVRLGLLQESYTGLLQRGERTLCYYMAGLFLEESSEKGLWKRTGVWSLSAAVGNSQPAEKQATFSRIPGVRTGKVTLI
jgi:hypothetical protein